MSDTEGKISIVHGDSVTIHSYLAPEEGDLVCSQIIETASRLVIVDAQLLKPYAQEVRAYADGLGKPIDRVVLSHAHPDHFCGLEVFADVPIHATPMTTWIMNSFGQGVMDFKRQSLGDRAHLLAERFVAPTHQLDAGPETIDGVGFVFQPVLDCEQTEVTMVELPAMRALIAQDVIYNGIYPVVGDKNPQREYMFDGWIAALKEIQGRDYAVILPGHGGPCDPSVIPGMIEFIAFGKQLFEAGTPADEFKAKVIERYPNLKGPDLIDYSVIFLYYSNW